MPFYVGRLPIAGDDLRCGISHFKLVAHFLDLRGLRFEGCSESLNFLLLLCEGQLEIPLLLRIGRLRLFLL
jgi:hypothetical protein